MRNHSLSILSAAVLLVPAFAGLTAKGASAAPAVQKASVTTPMTFARNEGQAPRGIRYLGASAGVSVAFTDSGVTINLTKDSGGKTGAVARTSVALRFVHADQHPEITGADRSAAVVNDLRGSDRARRHSGIRTFGKVVYHDLWPGIDGIFSTRNGTLKYSFTLAPGADPTDIRLSYAGADRVALDHGGLAVTVGRTVLHDQAPVSFQGGRRVTTGYRLLGSTDFGFNLGRYSRATPLTVDPGLEYGTFLGAADDHASSTDSIGHDAAGNLYVFGQTSSPGFPTTAGSYQPDIVPSGNPGQDAVDYVVTKLDPTGTHLIYSTFVGGSGIDTYARGAVGDDGAVYVSGLSRSSDFPTTTGAFRRTPYPTEIQGVAFKLDPAGSRLVYGTYLAPDFTGVGAKVGADGSLTIGGFTSSDLAPTTAGAYLPDYPGGIMAGYIVRLDPAGSELRFATYLGAPITDQMKDWANPSCYVFGIAVDKAGATYATGECSNGLPTTPGTFQATKKGLASIVVKLDPTGGKADYATYLGDTDQEIVRADAVAVDRDGHAWVVGDAPPDTVPTTSDAYSRKCVSTAGYPYCAMITEYDSSGHVLYSTYFAATGDQTSPLGGVTTDDEGRVYVAGFTGAGLPTTPDAYSTTPGTFDVPFYLAVFEKGALRYSTYFGGTSMTCAGALCGFVAGGPTIDPQVSAGTVYLGGTTVARNFPVTPGSYLTTYPGTNLDAIFAAKLTLPWATPTKH